MYLYGASGHAKVILEILEASGIKVNALFDDNPDITSLVGYEVLGPLNQQDLPDGLFIVSIGNNALRKKVATSYDMNFATAIHPSATLSKRCNIGEGTVIMGHSIVNADTVIGKHAIINTAASVDHDCVLEDYVHISPNATLSGGVTVGEGAHVGSGAVIIPNIRIGKWAMIGAGAVVFKDVPDYATVVGNPGKIIKIRKSHG